MRSTLSLVILSAICAVSLFSLAYYLVTPSVRNPIEVQVTISTSVTATILHTNYAPRGTSYLTTYMTTTCYNYYCYYVRTTAASYRYTGVQTFTASSINAYVQTLTTNTHTTTLVARSEAGAVISIILGIGVLIFLAAKPRRKASTQAPIVVQEVLADRRKTTEPAKPVSTLSPTKFCRECGAKIPRDSKFCEECGSRLV